MPEVRISGNFFGITKIIAAYPTKQHNQPYHLDLVIENDYQTAKKVADDFVQAFGRPLVDTASGDPLHPEIQEQTRRRIRISLSREFPLANDHLKAALQTLEDIKILEAKSAETLYENLAFRPPWHVSSDRRSR